MTAPSGGTTGGNTAPQVGLPSCQGLDGPCSTTLTPIALTGCSTGDYAADITVGGQTFSMIVDSGSGTLGVAGKGCTNCSMVSPLYSPSATAVDVGTKVSSQYGGGNGWNGVVYRDSVSLGSALPTVTMAFADITQQTMSSMSRNFFSPTYCSGTAQGPLTQGILGLSSTKLALKGTDVYLDDLKATGKLADAFSFQSCDIDGNLWLGGYDPTSISAEPQFTPMNSDNGFYLVAISDVAVDGNSIGLAASSYGTTIVDTGSSVMTAPPEVVDALAKSLESNPAYLKYIGAGWFTDVNASCTAAAGNATKADLDAKLPPLQLSFPQMQGNGSITVKLPPTESYLSPSVAPDGSLCFFPGIMAGTLSDTQTLILMGNSVMHSQVVIFDRANSQLGFAPQIGCK